MSKTALITGITGQDGSYLADLLLQKGYKVYGLVRRASTFNTARIDHLYENSEREGFERFDVFRGDLTDINSLLGVLKKVQPDEIYNLAAQSHVRVSFDMPIYTAEVVALGCLKLIEAIHSLGLVNTKLYQASSSEMFGGAPPPQDEETPFSPRSPYAVAKVAAHQFCVNYRDAYDMWIANGILFNHESPRRGETFVTRKITRAIAKIKLGIEEKLVLGNLYSRRDWGYAPDYVEAMWRMLQQDKPDDFVIATGETHTVKEFVDKALMCAGFEIEWEGTGLDEKGIDSKTGKVLIEISEAYFRPTEVDVLLGDPKKAKQHLGWEPKVTFDKLVEIMAEADLKQELTLWEGTKSLNQK